jgi:hypothetical protein
MKKMILATLFMTVANTLASSLMYKHKKLIPLGMVRVTKYTHNEGGWWTSSGYRMKEKDAMSVCAISRDWWRRRVKPGDAIQVDGIICRALDTMALKNRKGFRQRKWIDIFNGSKVEESLDYGIQKHQAYIVKEM